MYEVHRESPCACTIGGSDSCGGAGIQADLKTFSSLGVWGTTIITSVTAQNPARVTGTWPLPADAVRMQLEAVLEEYELRFFKTGMLANAEIIDAVTKSLPKDAQLVLDPVMISTSGARLLEEEAESILAEVLIPQSLLVTPNLHEAAHLSGMEQVKSAEEIRRAGDLILDMGAKAVLIKGGHGEGDCSTDTLVTGSGTVEFSGIRYPGDVHGTGCCLSAAITAFLSKGAGLEEACRQAKIFTGRAISTAFSGKSNIRSVNPTYGAGNYNNKY